MRVRVPITRLALLTVLVACTYELSPTAPPEQGDEPLPGDAEDVGERAPEVDVTLKIDWLEVADAPLARFEEQSAVVGGQLYVIGGYTDGSVIPKTFEADVYDPVANTWEQLPDMPRPITHAGISAHGADIYLAGGVVGSDDPADQRKTSATTEVWRFDTESLEWSEGTPLPIPRGAGALAVLGDTLHYFGGTGEDRQQEVGDHWQLDLNDPGEWLERAPLPNPANHLAGVVAGGSIYAVGGQHGHNETLETQRTVQVYDLDFDGWYEVAPLPQSLGHISNSTFELDDRIVVVGGETAFGSFIDEVLVYDPARDLWTNATPFPVAQNSMMGGVISGDLFLTGGSERALTTMKGVVEDTP